MLNAHMKQTHKNNHDSCPPLEPTEINLEPLLEAGFEPEDKSDEPPPLWRRLVGPLDDMNSEKWASEVISKLDSRAISRLVETLEDDREYYTKAVGETRVKAVYSHAKVMLFLKKAIEQGYGQAVIGTSKPWIRVSDYLHVMQIREQGVARRRRVSNRVIAGLLEVDESTIRRWDKRAQRLGVTLEDWDFDRLQQIVKPPRQAPP